MQTRFSLRRALPAAVALVAVLAMTGAALVSFDPASGAATGTGTTLVQQTFEGTTVTPQPWVVPATTPANAACLTTGSTSATPVPGCGTSRNGTVDGLQLTPDTTVQRGGVVYGSSVPTQEGLDATFNAYQWGGNGADGIDFFLAAVNPADPTVPTLGPAGGHLGYSGSTANPPGEGASHGYLGFGLDAYGNYGSTSFSGSGCTAEGATAGQAGRAPNSLDVRGPGNAETGYCVLASTYGDDLSGSLTSSHGVSVEVAINPSSSALSTASGLTVPAGSWKVAVNTAGVNSQGATCGGSVWCLSGSLPSASSSACTSDSGNGKIPAGTIPCTWLGSNGVPDQLSFGFTGSTGGSKDYHVVNTVKVSTFTGAPPTYAVTLSDNAAGSAVHGQQVLFTADATVTKATEHQQITVTDTLPSGLSAETTQDSLSVMGSSAGSACPATTTTNAMGMVQESCTYTPPSTGFAPGETLVAQFGAIVSASTAEQLVDDVAVSSADGVPATATVPVSISAIKPFARNIDWETADRISTTVHPTTAIATVTRTLSVAGEQLWYKFSVEPDEQLSVDLTNAHANYELYLFSDITALVEAQSTLSTGESLTQIEAESPENNANPVQFSAYASNGYASNGYASTGYASNGYASNGYASNGYASNAFNVAVADSLLAASEQAGAVTKSVTADTYNAAGTYYVEVTGSNGAFSATPFTLSVIPSGASCAVTLTTNVPGRTTSFPTTTHKTLSGLHTDVSTVIVTDSQTMPAVTSTATLAGDLASLASKTNGEVVNVGSSTAVQNLTNQADKYSNCPAAVNLEATAIANIVNSYRTQSPTTNLKYVVIVGDDDVIPFFRYADEEAIEQEEKYAHDVSLLSTTQAEAALETDYYLTDDPYGAVASLTIDGSSLPLQSAAVGRLVETTTQIKATIARYLGTTGSVIKPTSSLVAGYSFTAKPAKEIESAFKAGGVTGTSGSGTHATQLITNDGVTPNTIGTPPTKAWTAAQLSSLLTDGPHQLVDLAVHANSSVLLSADESTFLTTTTFSSEIGTDLKGALVLSGGCHVAYNVNPADTIYGGTLSWPEAFAAAGATLIAGTGYEYTDTNYISDSDQVDVDFARQLDETTSPVHIGTALLSAEWQYLASVEELDGLEEKALLETTLYGLPMLGVQMPPHTAAPSSGSSSVIQLATAPVVSSGPGESLHLRSAALKVTATYSRTGSTLTLGVQLPYYTGSQGVTSEPGSPIVPVQTENVSLPSETLRGVGLWKASYTDTTGPSPLVGDPAADTAPTPPPSFRSATYTPAKPWNPNYLGQLTSGSGTTLGVTPVQYVSTPSNSQDAIMRGYKTLTFRLFYSDTTGPAAHAAPPGISDVSFTYSGTTVAVSAEVGGAPTAGIQEVWITYTNPQAASPEWQSMMLTPPTGSTPAHTGTWTGSITLSTPAATDFIVQAVNGVGETSLDTNTGAYFTPAPLTSTGQPVAPASSSLTLSAPTSGVHGTPATVTATLALGTGHSVAGRPISLSIGSVSTVAFTGSTGTASAQIPLTALLPGQYTVTASFAGDAIDSPASESALLTVDPTPTQLALSLPSAGKIVSGSASGISATLRTAAGHPLAQQAVYFVVRKGSTIIDELVGTTTNTGVAQAGTLKLPAGDVGSGYSVSAYFGTATTPTTAGSLNAAVAGYNPASATAAVTVADATASTLVPNPSPATFGQTVKLTEILSPAGTSSQAWPTGTGTTHPTGTVTFKNGTTVLGKASLSLSSTGADTATLTVTGLQGGTHTLEAVYSGTTTFVGSSATTSEVVGFTQTISGTQSGSLTIKSGQVVLITGKVSGSISIAAGGGLEVDGGTVSGSIAASGAVGFTLCGATVSGAIAVDGSTGVVLIGGGTTGCKKSSLSGAITLSGNKAFVEVASSTISGPLAMSSNTGGLTVIGTAISGSVSVSSNKAPKTSAIEIAGNKISGSLACSGNTPAPTDAGKPNTVSGARSGQCDSPKTF